MTISSLTRIKNKAKNKLKKFSIKIIFTITETTWRLHHSLNSFTRSCKMKGVEIAVVWFFFWSDVCCSMTIRTNEGTYTRWIWSVWYVMIERTKINTLEKNWIRGSTAQQSSPHQLAIGISSSSENSDTRENKNISLWLLESSSSSSSSYLSEQSSSWFHCWADGRERISEHH